MKAYTIDSPGRLVPGIALTGVGAHAGVDVGARNAKNEPVLALTDPRATVDAEGRLVSAPGRGALLFVRDQAGVFGSWYLRAAQPDARWDAMTAAEAMPSSLDRILAMERIRVTYPHRAPVGWYEFARGTSGPVAENARLRVDLYGYLEDGASFEIRRRGRLEGPPSVFLVSCVGDEVSVTDPHAAALGRRGAGR